jgi:hypothetical protein
MAHHGASGVQAMRNPSLNFDASHLEEDQKAVSALESTGRMIAVSHRLLTISG